MTTILFRDADDLENFHVMIEGMEEIARDDGETSRADLLTRLLTHVSDAPIGQAHPLPDDLVPVARIVLENCHDNDEPVGTTLSDPSYQTWIQEVKGCLADMGASSYDEEEARKLFQKGKSPAAAAADLMPAED